MRSPIKGCRFSSSFAQSARLRHELYIDTGDGDRNTEIFEHFAERAAQIEAAYGRPLVWDELPNRRASRIAEYRDDAGVTDESRHDEFITWFLDAGVSLRPALVAVPLPP